LVFGFVARFETSPQIGAEKAEMAFTDLGRHFQAVFYQSVDGGCDYAAQTTRFG